MKEALLSIIKDEKRIITGQIDPQYLSDNLGRKKGTAEAVVFPVSTEEVSAVMRYAWENDLPVTPRGAGTNLVGSTVPSGHGIVLDLSLMNHVLELDEETFTATVEPGGVLADGTVVMAVRMKSMIIWQVFRKWLRKAGHVLSYLWKIKKSQPESGRSEACW